MRAHVIMSCAKPAAKACSCMANLSPYDENKPSGNGPDVLERRETVQSALTTMPYLLEADLATDRLRTTRNLRASEKSTRCAWVRPANSMRWWRRRPCAGPSASWSQVFADETVPAPELARTTSLKILLGELFNHCFERLRHEDVRG